MVGMLLLPHVVAGTAHPLFDYENSTFELIFVLLSSYMA